MSIKSEACKEIFVMMGFPCSTLFLDVSTCPIEAMQSAFIFLFEKKKEYSLNLMLLPNYLMNIYEGHIIYECTLSRIYKVLNLC